MRMAFVAALSSVILACTTPPAAAPPGGANAGGQPAPPVGGATASHAASAAAASPAPRERIRVAYPSVTGVFAGIFMAQEAGLFEKYGLEAELQHVTGGPAMISSLVAGEVHFGETSAPSPLAAALEGADVVYITEALDRPIMLLVTPREITAVEQLRGKPVGVTRIGTATYTFMKLGLRSAGLELDRDVQALQVGGQPETVAGLLSGQLFAGILAPPAHLQALEGGNMHVLLDLGNVGAGWPFAGTISTRQQLAANPERVRNYVKAYSEAVQLLRTDRERGVQVLAKYAQIDDRAIAEQTWELLRDRWALPPYPTAASMEVVVQEDLAPRNPRARELPLETFYDDRFVRELDASGFYRQLAGR